MDVYIYVYSLYVYAYANNYVWPPPPPIEFLLQQPRPQCEMCASEFAAWYDFAPGTPKQISVFAKKAALPRRRITGKSHPAPWGHGGQGSAEPQVLDEDEKKRMKETGEGCSKCRWHGTCWRCKRRQIIHMLAAEVGDEIHDDENLGALDGESNEVSDEFPVLEDPNDS